jgi:hypothetical protein
MHTVMTLVFLQTIYTGYGFTDPVEVASRVAAVWNGGFLVSL